MLIYPIQIQNGKAQTVQSFEQQVAQSVRFKVATSQGTEFFNREYGSLAKACIDEGIDAVGIARLKYWTREALKSLPTIRLERIDTNTLIDGKDGKGAKGIVIVSVLYRIIATNQLVNQPLTL